MKDQFSYRNKLLRYKHKGKRCEIGIIDDDSRQPDPEIDGNELERPLIDYMAQKIQAEQDRLARIYRGENA